MLNSTGTEADVAGLHPGTAYVFRVAALTSSGYGESSDPMRVSEKRKLSMDISADINGCFFPFAKVSTHEELDVPGPVQGLRARPTSSFSILVSWDPPQSQHASTPVTGYTVYYRQVQ